jgi:hypothetical protein
MTFIALRAVQDRRQVQAVEVLQGGLRSAAASRCRRYLLPCWAREVEYDAEESNSATKC